MKEIVLTDHFGDGGAERVASLLVKGLSDNGNDEVHVCLFEDKFNYDIDSTKVTIHILSSIHYPHFFNVLNRIKNLIKIIKEIVPDKIYSFGPIMASYVVLSVMLSGKRKKIKIISSERNDPRQEPVSDLKKKIRDFCYNKSDVIVCQTQMVIDLLQKRNIKSKFVIIPNPISRHLPQWNGINSKDIISAARLTEQKNLPLLINAFLRIHNEFPQYRLIIYGEGEQRKELQALITQKGLNGVVKLPGFVKDIHKIMSNAYMYVSSSDYEGISNSMLEALGIGLPCVCTDCPVGGAAMYIENGVTGILTRPACEDELYEGMKRYIIDKDFLLHVSQNSVVIRNQLVLDQITKKWIQL